MGEAPYLFLILVVSIHYKSCLSACIVLSNLVPFNLSYFSYESNCFDYSDNFPAKKKFFALSPLAPFEDIFC